MTHRLQTSFTEPHELISNCSPNYVVGRNGNHIFVGGRGGKTSTDGSNVFLPRGGGSQVMLGGAADDYFFSPKALRGLVARGEGGTDTLVLYLDLPAQFAAFRSGELEQLNSHLLAVHANSANHADNWYHFTTTGLETTT